MRVVERLRLGERLAIAVETEQRFADGLEQEGARPVARQTARDRGGRGDGRIAPRALRHCQHHRQQQRLHRHGEEEAFRKRDGRQHPHSVRMAGEAHGSVIEAAQHDAGPHSRTEPGGQCGAFLERTSGSGQSG